MTAPERFEGFAPGERVTPLPQAFWLELLPRMTDPAELLVTLYALDGLSRVRRFPRRLARSALRNTRALIEALDSLCPERELEQAFNDGLNAAVQRGSLLCERIQYDAGSPQAGWSDWIALNDADGRRAMAYAPSIPAPVTTPQPAQPRGAGASPARHQSARRARTPAYRTARRDQHQHAVVAPHQKGRDTAHLHGGRGQPGEQPHHQGDVSRRRPTTAARRPARAATRRRLPGQTPRTALAQAAARAARTASPVCQPATRARSGTRAGAAWQAWPLSTLPPRPPATPAARPTRRARPRPACRAATRPGAA